MKTLVSMCLLAILAVGCGIPRTEELRGPCPDGSPSRRLPQAAYCLEPTPAGKWRRVGPWVMLHPDGSVLLRGQFEGGQRAGVWTLFDTLGRVVQPTPPAPPDHAEDSTKHDRPNVHGGCDKKNIAQVVGAHLEALRDCSGALADVVGPLLQGRVKAHFVIAATGAVRTAYVGPANAAHPELTACVLDVLRTLVFVPPADPSGECHIVWPFVFTPG